MAQNCVKKKETRRKQMKEKENKKGTKGSQINSRKATTERKEI